MTSQLILKVLSLISLLATIAALYIWRQTGETPSPWVIRFAIASLAAALVLFVIDRETRPRVMLQFLSFLFAAFALFTFAADVTTSQGGFHAASLLERIQVFAPSLETSLKSGVTRILGAAAWDPVLISLLGLPAWLVGATLSMISGYAGRARNEVQIYIN